MLAGSSRSGLSLSRRGKFAALIIVRIVKACAGSKRVESRRALEDSPIRLEKKGPGKGDGIKGLFFSR